MDLLREWDHILGYNVSDKMLSWIDQVGYPLLTITSEDFTQDGKIKLNINQR